jgi:beta-aspartyl-peptidase (threonine type)
VAGVRTIRNPVLAALEVMREGRCVLLAADGAERLARERGLAIVEPSYFSTPQRLIAVASRACQGPRSRVDDDASAPPSESQRSGTVGAVARDATVIRRGNLHRGLTNKVPARIGDTPIVAAGRLRQRCDLRGVVLGHRRALHPFMRGPRHPRA